MAVTAANAISEPLATLRTLLSSLTIAQTWLEAADAAEALESIYLCQFDDADGEPGDSDWKTAAEALRPIILIGHEDFTAEAEDTGKYWHKEGSIYVLFEELAQNDTGVQTSTNTVSTSDACLHLMNAVGGIMEAFESAVSDGGTLHAQGWNIRDECGRTHPREEAAGTLDLAAMTLQVQREDM